MKVKTFAIVAGSKVCNAKCPFCIAKMTPDCGITYKEPEFNWDNFTQAKKLAKVTGATTVLITGKGEPTLYPHHIENIIRRLDGEFPIIELQTNGILLRDLKDELTTWYVYGLRVISLSISHFESFKNEEIVGSYLNLGETIKFLHSLGFSVRLSCLLIKRYIGSIAKVKECIQFAKAYNVEQLTFRTLGKMGEDSEMSQWVDKHIVPDIEININDWLSENGTKLMTIDYGLAIYDYEGQNVGITNCLTIKPEGENIRQLIYFPDGHIRYDWRYEGAIIL